MYVAGQAPDVLDTGWLFESAEVFRNGGGGATLETTTVNCRLLEWKDFRINLLRSKFAFGIDAYWPWNSICPSDRYPLILFEFLDVLLIAESSWEFIILGAS